MKRVNGVRQDSFAQPRSNLGTKAVFVAKSAGRRLRWFPHDLGMRLSGRSSLERPPLGISYVGHGPSLEVGSWYLEQFRSIGDLHPSDRVLDIGCGIGRMAVPLTGYLDQGSYQGFDTSKAMVKWCQRNISRDDPRFTFRVASIYNRKYNPFGEIPAHQFRFPYEDDSFDFVFATSVFTHLGIWDAKRYLSEIFRVLDSGGTAFLTFFVLRPDSVRSGGPFTFDFSYEFGPLKTTDPREPEAAVAWPEELLLLEAESSGLMLKRPIVAGSWTEKRVGPDIQDIVVLSAGKQAPAPRKTSPS